MSEVRDYLITIPATPRERSEMILSYLTTIGERLSGVEYPLFHLDDVPTAKMRLAIIQFDGGKEALEMVETSVRGGNLMEAALRGHELIKGKGYKLLMIEE